MAGFEADLGVGSDSLFDFLVSPYFGDGWMIWRECEVGSCRWSEGGRLNGACGGNGGERGCGEAKTAKCITLTHRNLIFLTGFAIPKI